jgi:hypothetical protein
MKLKAAQRFYKIRDTETGLFSSGGVWPRFTKFGKTWTTRGALKSHLTMLGYYARWSDSASDSGYGNPPKPRYVVVEYTVTAVESNAWFVANEAERPAKK